jgi:hypothetical protein
MASDSRFTAVSSSEAPPRRRMKPSVMRVISGSSGSSYSTT